MGFMLVLAVPPLAIAYCIVASFTRLWRGAALAAILGVVLASGLVLWAYLAGGLRNTPDTGGDFGITGRVFLIAAIAIVGAGWFLGLGAAVGVRLLGRWWEKTEP